MEETDRQYREALEYVQGFTDYERLAAPSLTAASFDLRRMRGLLRHLGNPQENYRCIVVAGTKGKGSTAAMIDAILRAAGQRVGFYSQPHLHTYRERIRVDGSVIRKEQMVARMPVVMEAVTRQRVERPGLAPPTTYEVGTALAFQHFAEEGVQTAVLEVGMGGRLDAVNVVSPAVAVITGISLDHMAVLGNTVQEIAREKGGIVKPGSKVVIAPQRPEALAEILGICLERGSEAFLVQQDWSWSHVRGGVLKGEDGLQGQVMNLRGPCGEYGELFLPLLGPHQLVNAATAVATCEVLRHYGLPLEESHVRRGLASVRWPGRFEVAAERPFVVLDGAHNRDSAERLVVALRSVFPGCGFALIVGTSVDKDIGGIAEALSSLAGSVWVTRSNHPRAAIPAVVAAAFASAGVEARIVDTVGQALQGARRRVRQGDVVCVTGSLFVVAEAREALGLAEETD